MPDDPTAINESAPVTYEFGPYRLNIQDHLLSRDGVTIPLTPKAFDVLSTLVRSHGHMVGKAELMQSVWGDSFVEESNLTQDISVLRRVLGDRGDYHHYIETIPRCGYRFVAPVTEFRNEAVVTGCSATNQASSRRRFVRGSAVAAVLILAALGGVWIGRKWPVSDEQAQVPVPLTTYPGNEVQPSFSPDGTQVAFVWDGERQDNADVYTKMIGIGPDKPLRLTTDPASDISPAWSPDGRFIAFVRQQYQESGKASVLTVPAGGGPERLVADLAYPLPRPASSQRCALSVPFPLLAWTPNSKSLVIVDRLSPRGPLALFRASLESGEKNKLTSPPESSFGDGAPAVSPDGASLLFVRVEDRSGYTNANLYQLPLSAGTLPRGEPQRLTSSKTWLMTPVWFPDGRQILFSKATSPLQDLSLWTMRAEPGAKERVLASLGENSGWPAISAAKSRLVFARRYSDTNVWRLPLRDGAAAGPPEKLIYSVRDDAPAQYSPDGARIVFTSNRTGVFEVWVCDKDGSNAVRITDMGRGMTGSPRWSPDGKLIVFDSNADGQWDIYATPATGGGLRRLTNDRAADAMASFSRDGRSVYFRSDRSGTAQIWRMTAEGREAVQITRNGGFSPIESIDGTFVYYRRGQDLWRMPVQEGVESKVLESVYATNYTIGNRGIYFVAMPDMGRNISQIRFFRFATGEISTMATIQGIPAWGLSVSPGEEYLLYSKVDQSGSDLMLVEDFH